EHLVLVGAVDLAELAPRDELDRGIELGQLTLPDLEHLVALEHPVPELGDHLAFERIEAFGELRPLVHPSGTRPDHLVTATHPFLLFKAFNPSKQCAGAARPNAPAP